MPFLVFLLVILVSSPCLGQMLDESVDQGLSQMPDESTNQIWKSTNQVRESTDQVWEVGDRRWTVEEERRFEKWVDETITEDFFIRYEIPRIVRMLFMQFDGFMPGSTIFLQQLRQGMGNGSATGPRIGNISQPTRNGTWTYVSVLHFVTSFR